MSWFDDAVKRGNDLFDQKAAEEARNELMRERQQREEEESIAECFNLDNDAVREVEALLANIGDPFVVIGPRHGVSCFPDHPYRGSVEPGEKRVRTFSMRCSPSEHDHRDYQIVWYVIEWVIFIPELRDGERIRIQVATCVDGSKRVMGMEDLEARIVQAIYEFKKIQLPTDLPAIEKGKKRKRKKRLGIF